VFSLMTKWIERYRRQAEERYRRLDDVLRTVPDNAAPDEPDDAPTTTPRTGTGTGAGS
jgi:hypothetical protein